MRSRISLTTASLLLAAAGCAAPDPGLEQKRSLNTWLMNSLQNDAADNAIVRQHTLYPYHFVPDSAELTDLGQSDLAVLGAHYREAPGTLNVRQGDAPDEVYRARKQKILQELARAGVATDRMALADGLPGGDGADSGRVILSLSPGEEKSEAPPTTPTPGARSSGAGKSGAAMKVK